MKIKKILKFREKSYLIKKMENIKFWFQINLRRRRKKIKLIVKGERLKNRNEIIEFNKNVLLKLDEFQRKINCWYEIYITFIKMSYLHTLFPKLKKKKSNEIFTEKRKQSFISLVTKYFFKEYSYYITVFNWKTTLFCSNFCNVFGLLLKSKNFLNNFRALKIFLPY